METRTYTVYKYDELTGEQKQKALDHLYDLNIDHDWWDFTYEDARNIGLELTGFDLYRRNIKGKFIEGALECAEKILKERGKTCETYKTASKVIEAPRLLDEKFTYGRYTDDDEQDWEDLEIQFLYDLLEDYLSMLSKEYDYLTSRESIEETIRANEYDFTSDGKLA
jgi:hypothetical protein